LKGLTINNKGRLTFDGYDLAEIADDFGTPLYVISEKRIRENYRRIYQAYKKRYDKIRVAYAVKANYTLAVVRILADEGADAEVLPGCEVLIALKAGISPSELILTGNNKTEKEFKEALNADVGIIVLDSVSELAKLSDVAKSLDKTPKVMLRVNPLIDISSHPNISTATRETKFGIDIQGGVALKAFEKAVGMQSIDVVGVHAHIGSQILSVEPFKEEVEKILDFVKQLHDKLNFTPTYIDLGGGYGIAYTKDEAPLNPESVAVVVTDAVKSRFDKWGIERPTIILEPGRSLVGDAEVLLAQVGNIKNTSTIKYASVNASTNLLPGIFLENRRYEVAVANKAGEKPEEVVSISGPLCFSGDVIAKACELPRVEEGDIIAILNTGAYCQVGASMFNATPRPATLLLGENSVDIIQKSESCEDIMARDVLPPRLSKK